jgi:O-antigen/teichoic acid export membrane protein
VQAPARPPRTRVLRTIGGLGGATAVSLVVNLVGIPLVLHRVGAELYGAWAAIASLMAVATLADAGLRMELQRRIAAALGQGDSAALENVVRQTATLLASLAITVIALGMAFAPEARAFTFPGGVPGYEPAMVDMVIRATIAIVGLSLLSNVGLAVLRGAQRGDLEGLVLAGSLVAGTSVTVGAASAGWGLGSLVAGASVEVLCTLIAGAIAARRILPPASLRLALPRTALLWSVLGMSSLVLLTQLGDVVDSQWDRVVLARFTDPGVVASFTVGVSAALQAKMIATIPITPLIAGLAGRARDEVTARHLFDLLARAHAAVATVALVGAAVFAPAFIRLWVGTAAPQAGWVVQLFVIALACNLWVAPLAYRAIAVGAHSLAATASAINIVVNGVTSYVLASHMGLLGALLGSILGNATAAVAFLILLRWRMPGISAFPRSAAPVVGVGVTLICLGTTIGTANSWWELMWRALALLTPLTLATLVVEGLHMRRLALALKSRGSTV